MVLYKTGADVNWEDRTGRTAADALVSNPDALFSNLQPGEYAEASPDALSWVLDRGGDLT